MARPERFELPTPTFVALYSIQLSYGRTANLILSTTCGRRRLHNLFFFLWTTPMEEEARKKELAESEGFEPSMDF